MNHEEDATTSHLDQVRGTSETTQRILMRMRGEDTQSGDIINELLTFLLCETQIETGVQRKLTFFLMCFLDINEEESS